MLNDGVNFVSYEDNRATLIAVKTDESDQQPRIDGSGREREELHQQAAFGGYSRELGLCAVAAVRPLKQTNRNIGVF